MRGEPARYIVHLKTFQPTRTSQSERRKAAVVYDTVRCDTMLRLFRDVRGSSETLLYYLDFYFVYFYILFFHIFATFLQYQRM